jgi:hypothetical protein
MLAMILTAPAPWQQSRWRSGKSTSAESESVTQSDCDRSGVYIIILAIAGSDIVAQVRIFRPLDVPLVRNCPVSQTRIASRTRAALRRARRRRTTRDCHRRDFLPGWNTAPGAGVYR